MKKLLIALLVVLIIILILVIGLGIYAYTIVKPYLSSGSLEQSIDSTIVVDKHPLLTDSQEATLEKLGVDPAKLPTEITPAMEACFTEKLGIDRVNAIVGGETPGILDVVKAKSCIE